MIFKSVRKAGCYIADFLQSAVRCDASSSLLTRNESNGIKGFLILLIVLGHNKYVMQGGQSNLFLYSFHVYAFYYLPFLYDFKKSNWIELIGKNLRRFYVPYTLVFGLLGVIAYLSGTLAPVGTLALTYICGSQYMLGQSFGMGSFLWFIPTMFSVMLFRRLYYVLNMRLRVAMLGVSLLCLVGFTYLMSFYIYTWWYSPICLTVALAMIFPAVCLREVCKRIDVKGIVIAFFLLTLSMMVFYPVNQQYPYSYLTINRLICPILIFSMLLTVRERLAQSNTLVDFGKMSFRIYLIHIFIYNAIYRFADGYAPDIYFGLGVFVITFSLSYAISKLPILKYAFPR